MSFFLKNIADLYVQNGLTEGGFGLVALVAPALMFPGVGANPSAKLIARWWASAVICIGATSLLVSTLPASNIGRQFAGVGFLIYHVLLSLQHLRFTDRERVRSDMLTFTGLAVHLYFSIRFLLVLHTAGTLQVAADLFMA